MAVDNSRKKATPPRPNLPPEGQPWGRWVTDTLNELKLETGGVKREVISSNKNHNAQLQMSAQQKREIVKVNLKAEEALNIALAASGSTTIYFAAPETPEQGDIWYENVTGIWFRWVDDQWVPITDETLLEALEAILAQRIANDDKIRTFAQPDAPTGMTAEYVGDLWYDTDDKNKLYRWDGIEWVPIRDAGITEAQDAADAAQGTADDAKNVADDAKETADTAADTVSQLEAQVTADLGAMQGRLVTAEGELTTLTGTTLPALDSRLGSAESAVSAAEGRLTDAEAEISSLDTDLGTASGNISDLIGRVGTVESDVTAAQGTADQAESDAAAALSAAQTADGKAVLAQQSADGKSTVTYGTSKKSSGAAGKEGDTHYVYSGSNLIATQRRTATAWVDAELGHQIIGSVDLGKATVGQLDGQYIKADTITGGKILGGSITATDAVFATGAIQNADIGNLNASKINAGTLNANRIGADTIEGKHIKGGSITATHGVFATGAIQSADIGSINANTITVGTLSGIDITGVNITGSSNIETSGTFSVTRGGVDVLTVFPDGIELGSDVTPLTTHWFQTNYGDLSSDPENTYLSITRQEYTDPSHNTTAGGAQLVDFGQRRNVNSSPTVTRFSARMTTVDSETVHTGSLVVKTGNNGLIPGWTKSGILLPRTGDVPSKTSGGALTAPRIEGPGFGGGATDSDLRMTIRKAVLGSGFIDSEDRTIVSPVITGSATINGSPIPRMATGSVYTGADSGAGNNQTHNISFPPGRFTSPPLVQVTSVNTFGRAISSVDNITTSGARVVTQRVGSGWGAGEVHWIATQG